VGKTQHKLYAVGKKKNSHALDLGVGDVTCLRTSSIVQTMVPTIQISFTTLGLLVIDEIHFGSHSVKDVLGGSGAYGKIFYLIHCCNLEHLDYVRHCWCTPL
jgi:hypothetical protein